MKCRTFYLNFTFTSNKMKGGAFIMKKQAFTLIELLIVVAIIAILAAIAVPNFLEAQVRSKVSRGRADMRSVTNAIVSYQVDHNRLAPMGDISTDPNGAFFHARTSSYLTTPISYISSLPYDPFVEKTSTWYNSTYPIETGVGKRYVYYDAKVMVEVIMGGNDIWGGLEEWAGSYLIYGYGPDKNPFQGSKATLLPYDPTNGTVSPGNVIRSQNKTDGIPLHPETGTFLWP